MQHRIFRFLAGLSICLSIPSTLSVLTSKAYADTVFPSKQLTTQLIGNTSVPIFLPDSLPFEREVYFTGKVTPNGYSIQMGATPDCSITACFIGAIVAEKDGIPATPTTGPRQEFSRLQLVNGIAGVFSKSCGAYCNAFIEWQYEGVLYRVFMKNGSQDILEEIANRAIKAGPRSLARSSNQQSFILFKQGDLGPGSLVLDSDNSFYEEYEFRGQAGQSVIITLESQEFDTYLAVFSPDNKLLEENDDLNRNNSNSQITVTLPKSGVYRVIVNTYDEKGRGRYTLTVR